MVCRVQSFVVDRRKEDQKELCGLQDLRDGVEEVDPANLLKNEEESNNLNEESNTIEQKNERELEDDFEVYNFEENQTLMFASQL